MPRKVFSAGEVLTAADTNTFLSDQVVMTFADSDARGSAIPTPVEGMVTYLADTNAYEFFDGEAFVKLANPMTAEGDLITGGTAGVAERIELGSAGLVLTSDGTAPVWSAPAGGGASWELVNAGGTTLVGSSTVTISGLVDYTSLKIVVNVVKFATAPQTQTLQINGLTSNYQLPDFRIITESPYSVNIFNSSLITNSIPFGTSSNNAYHSTIMGSCLITGAQAGSIKEISYETGGVTGSASKTQHRGGGVYTITDAITSVSLVATAAYTQGTIFVYGA